MHRLPTLSLRSRIGKLLMTLAGVGAVAGMGSSCNLDPVHRAGVNSLGDEAEDLYPPESEWHRPGEPCGLCHSSAGPADNTFVLAGTIFWGPDRYDRRVDQAYVRIAGPENTTKCFVTNCNGNFFVRPVEYQNLKFPLLVSVERVKNPGGREPDAEQPIRIRRMTSHIGREASCATCHILNLRDFGSPGQIRLFDTESEVDQANPPITIPCPDEAPRVTRCPEDRQ
ncbi:MAG: hypothetical protein KF819_19735 [Labilithrix sp.]|nr:hypothetical protein [Labilithrix sp.]